MDDILEMIGVDWHQKESRCLNVAELTLKNFMDRVFICKFLAKRNEIVPFLKRMLTGHEKWVTYDNLKLKRSLSGMTVGMVRLSILTIGTRRFNEAAKLKLILKQQR